LRQLRHGLKKRHQAIGLRIRQPAQQYSIHHAEDGGVRPDSERQRGHHYGGQRRILAHGSQRETDVLQRAVQPQGSTGVAAIFFHLIHSAELLAGFAACLRLRHSLADVIGHQLIEMESKLAVELSFLLFPTHGAAPSAKFTMSPMAVASRFQFAVSVFRCERPFAVKR